MTAGIPAGGPLQTLPLWYARGLIVTLAGVVGFGGVGLLLADLGVYSLARAAALGSVGVAAGVIVAVRLRPLGPTPRTVSVPALAMVAFALGLALWNGAYAGHHLSVDRDPGVYQATGKWIADNGTLVVDPNSSGLFAPTEGYRTASAGMYPLPGGTLEFQFAHMYPVLMAEADGVGGDRLMFRTGAVLGSLALIAVFAVGCRLTRRPWVALAAVAGLGLSLPQLYFSRDSYSEPATQLLLWGGIWLLLEAYERLSPSLGVLAGACIGATLMTRIDAVAYLILLPPLAAVAWLTCPPVRRRRLLSVGLATVAGGLPTALLGTLDVQRRAGNYYHDLRASVVVLYQACLVFAVASVLLVALWPRLGRLRSWAERHRDRLAVAAAASVMAALFALWFLRPAFTTSHQADDPAHHPYNQVVAGLQRQAGLVVDLRRTFWEQSMNWLSWYLGPVALTLAIAGLTLLVLRASRRPTEAAAPVAPAALVVLAVTGVLTVAYLWKPTITSDQVWAMRRYLPASLPLLALAAALAVVALGELVAAAVPREGRALRTGVVGTACALIVAAPLATTWPVRHVEQQAGVYPVVRRLCDTIGPEGAVVFASQGPTGGGQLFGQTVRSYCHVPVAMRTGPYTGATASTAAQAWHERGRTLWVVALTSAALTRALPGSTPVLVSQATSSRELEVTLIRPPSRYVTAEYRFFAAKVQ